MSDESDEYTKNIVGLLGKFFEDSQADKILTRLDAIEKVITQMAVSQAQFDTDLSGLVSSIGTLITAVQTLAAKTPAADLTAEDNQVIAAAASVAGELNALNPPTPVPVPTPPPAHA